MRSARHAGQFALDFAAPRPRRVETPIARRADPRTSHLAATHVTATGKRAQQQDLTAAAVRDLPGRTSHELAKHTKLDRHMLARRLSECVTAGTVRKGPSRTCSITGRQALTWLPT